MSDYTIPAAELAVGAEVYYSVHADAITVTSVRHDVQHSSGTYRVTVVNGVDVHGTLVDLRCLPDFPFLRADRF